ncbi:unnamed protein product [Cuscuta epithymum]|uniref:Uncharacterized protein n=1 Tax=Cuscuta epithymum TaxID=186058 RepID=A0AAV0DCV1_9ASTE|nr:unnamed protein product [Cuscuta epithymum]
MMILCGQVRCRTMNSTFNLDTPEPRPAGQILQTEGASPTGAWRRTAAWHSRSLPRGAAGRQTTVNPFGWMTAVLGRHGEDTRTRGFQRREKKRKGKERKNKSRNNYNEFQEFLEADLDPEVWEKVDCWTARMLRELI